MIDMCRQDRIALQSDHKKVHGHVFKVYNAKKRDAQGAVGTSVRFSKGSPNHCTNSVI
ncbi:hypothetical protein DPMN_087614 [Dreissena polymorpha]|uniref:Uncharacterized protein n=1 Tax=Dreissena polymorpha TaxID=45954 RepID=A0A9D4KT31_DREPO|nr:hypothetical protein DPMN_087614 [Dreissena polymorpha]